MPSTPFELPLSGYVRQKQLLLVLPMSAASLWRGVKAKTFPSPVKLGPAITAWKVEDIRQWMADREAA